jgi:hypothetical protein
MDLSHVLLVEWQYSSGGKMTTDLKTIEALNIICDHLSERTATLFLGAGVNAGIASTSGDLFPNGKELSKWICIDLLNSPDLEINLDDAAEMARFKLGSHEVNRYLFDKFSLFVPGTAHLSLIQLPWDVIYTTNFDLLVEKACESLHDKAAGKIKVIFNLQKDITSLNELSGPLCQDNKGLSLRWSPIKPQRNGAAPVSNTL